MICHHAECLILFIIMLNAIMISAIMLKVMAPNLWSVLVEILNVNISTDIMMVSV
jgi:hypothetical protein